tara:strand:- start:83 stop:823 length:741 start_codon:yes stop_codon:yes gene_type:complete
MATNYNPSIVRDDLLLCLDAGNSKSYSGSGTDWFDLSGNNFHMKLKNSPSFTTFNGASCFDLDGSNDYGKCDGTVSGSVEATVASLGIGGTTPKTVVCVACVDNGVGSTSGGLFDVGNTGVHGRHYNLRLINNYTSWRAQFWGTPDYDFSYDGRSKWTMYNIVYGTDKIGRTFRDDSVLLGNDSGAYNLVTAGNRSFEMGRYNGGGYFGGKIALYLVYKRGLSVPEMRQNYYALRKRFSLKHEPVQ